MCSLNNAMGSIIRSGSSRGMIPETPELQIHHHQAIPLPPAPLGQEDQNRREGAEELKEEDEEHQEQDSTLVLPDECLGLVFDCLDIPSRNSASLVCRRWLAAEASSRRILTLSAASTLPIPSLAAALTRFSALQKLGLKCSRGVRSISDDALHTVAAHCRQLTKLKLKYCTALTDAGLEAFAAAVSSSSFRSFSCCSCGFGADGLSGLIRHCKSLEDLSVKKLRLQNGFVSGPSNLKRLSIKHVDSGRGFAHLIATSRRLHTLIIFKAIGKWDQLLEFIVGEEGLRELVELRMEKIVLGDKGLEAVARCKKLQVLFLTRTPECSNTGIAAVANGCRSLRKLHVDGCFSGRIGDRGLLSIAQKCPELKELVLIGLSATSESLGVLFSNCAGLERLALWNSETFGDRELSCIATKCRALRKLCIKCCPISDKGLEALAMGCPSLSKVKIKKCRGVSAAATSTLMTAHNGLIITLESDIPPILAAVAAAAAGGGGGADEEHQQQGDMDQNRAGSSLGRSPFSRARSAILAALGRVLS